MSKTPLDVVPLCFCRDRRKRKIRGSKMATIATAATPSTDPTIIAALGDDRRGDAAPCVAEEPMAVEELCAEVDEFVLIEGKSIKSILYVNKIIQFIKN